MVETAASSVHRAQSGELAGDRTVGQPRSPEPSRRLARIESLVEGVAFDPGLRPYDGIHDMRGLENQGCWTASRTKVSRVRTEDDKGD